MTSSTRQLGRKANGSSNAATSASHLSTSCTSNVQLPSGVPPKSASPNGPELTCQRSRFSSCTIKPCQCAFLAGQSSEIVRLQRWLEVGKGVADQQRSFLPVVAQETGRATCPADGARSHGLRGERRRVCSCAHCSGGRLRGAMSVAQCSGDVASGHGGRPTLTRFVVADFKTFTWVWACSGCRDVVPGQPAGWNNP